MGQGQSGLPGGPGKGAKKGEKKDEEKKKWQPPKPSRVGKKRKKKGPTIANKLPSGTSSV